MQIWIGLISRIKKFRFNFSIFRVINMLIVLDKCEICPVNLRNMDKDKFCDGCIQEIPLVRPWNGFNSFIKGDYTRITLEPCFSCPDPSDVIPARDETVCGVNDCSYCLKVNLCKRFAKYLPLLEYQAKRFNNELKILT